MSIVDAYMAVDVIQVVNYLLRGWIKNLESDGSNTLPLLDDPESVRYDIAKDLEFVRDGSARSVSVRFFGSKFSLWNQISSYFKSRLGNVQLKS